MSTKPWQQKALARGRTPLPETPGDQPRLAPQGVASSSASVASGPPSSGTRSLAPISAAAQASSQAPVATGHQSYRFWLESELRRLIEMRNGGAEWSAIFRAFPNRTPEALKQTYHKRRHTMERRMEEEQAAAVATAGDAGSVEKEADDENKGAE